MLNTIGTLTPGAFYRFETNAAGQLISFNLSARLARWGEIPENSLDGSAELLFSKIPEPQCYKLKDQIAQSHDTLSDLRCVFTFRTERYGEVWLETRARPKRINDSVTQWKGFVFSISAIQQKYQRLMYEEGLAHSILDNMLDAIITTDEHGIITYVNNVTSQMFGYRQPELVGKNITVLMPSQDRHLHDGYLAAYKVTHQPHIIGHTRRLEAVDRKGRAIPIELRVCEVDSHGQFKFMGVIRDLRPTARFKAQMEDLQQQDATTGLLNRDGLIKAMSSSLSTCILGDIRHFTLVSIDVDDFHLINDGFGVAAGDQVIGTIGKRLSKVEGIAAARIHKDEFALLLEDRTTSYSIAMLIRQLTKILETPIEVGEHSISFRLSFGVCLFDSNHATSASELLRQSQSALSNAKSGARGGFWLYDPLTSEDTRASAIIDQKLKAEHFINELHLVFQPQFDWRQEIVGYEALVRWETENRVIFPDQFIPIAERNGAIIAIGNWVVEQACALIAQLNTDAFATSKRLSINISPKQFRHPRFVETIKHTIAKYGIDPRLLRLELTERLLIESVGEVVEKMHTLNDIGVSFSLDDFGTGFSSLSYLSNLPLAELKIDRSFVTDLKPSTNNYQIVQTIISLSKSLGLDVIAEGVETSEEHQLLQQMGCHFYQGYFFAQPTRWEVLHKV